MNHLKIEMSVFFVLHLKDLEVWQFIPLVVQTVLVVKCIYLYKFFNAILHYFPTNYEGLLVGVEVEVQLY
jgi:hypothetical protein